MSSSDPLRGGWASEPAVGLPLNSLARQDRPFPHIVGCSPNRALVQLRTGLHITTLPTDLRSVAIASADRAESTLRNCHRPRSLREPSDWIWMLSDLASLMVEPELSVEALCALRVNGKSLDQPRRWAAGSMKLPSRDSAAFVRQDAVAAEADTACTAQDVLRANESSPHDPSV